MDNFHFGESASHESNEDPVKIAVSNLTVKYENKNGGEPKIAIDDVSVDIRNGLVTAFIGASGCGKSTLIKSINRMNDRVVGCRVSGHVRIDEVDVLDKNMDVVRLRSRVGMVFQKANPFPKTIYENVAYGPRIHGLASNKQDLDGIVEESLRKAALWDEVKDDLKSKSGTQLSGGQQQRLCIARAIAVKPEILLMDEPCSALDPRSTSKIENLMDSLSHQFTIVIVTHSMQQAARISHRTVFFHEGKIVEEGRTKDMFVAPKSQQTSDYICGRYG